MQDQLTRATWWLVSATIGLVGTGVGGIVFVWLQLWTDRRQKRVENLEKQIEVFEGDRFRHLRSKLAGVRLKGDSLAPLDLDYPPSEAYEILDFFEHIALLVRERNLSRFGVWHSFGPWIGASWSDFKELLAIEQVHSPATYCDFTWLVKRMRQVERKNNDEGGMDYDDEELEGHYSYERTVSDVPVLRSRRSVKNKKARKVPVESNREEPNTVKNAKEQDASANSEFSSESKESEPDSTNLDSASADASGRDPA